MLALTVAADVYGRAARDRVQAAWGAPTTEPASDGSFIPA
jgi:hypothetical protein